MARHATLIALAFALSLIVPPALARNTNNIPGAPDSQYADMVDYETLCTGEDWIFFNAVSSVDGKLVSVCMMEGDDATPSHLSLRYGVPGDVNLFFPRKAEGSFEAFTIRRYTRPQTTYLKFEFTLDGLNYEILEGSEGVDYSAFLQVLVAAEGTVVVDDALAVATPPLSLMGLEGLVPGEPFDE